jgi:hypothetical protein
MAFFTDYNYVSVTDDDFDINHIRVYTQDNGFALTVITRQSKHISLFIPEDVFSHDAVSIPTDVWWSTDHELFRTLRESSGSLHMTMFKYLYRKYIKSIVRTQLELEGLCGNK